MGILYFEVLGGLLARKSNTDLNKTLGVVLSVIVVFIALKHNRSFEKHSTGSESCKNAEEITSKRPIETVGTEMALKASPSDKKDADIGQEVGQKNVADIVLKQDSEIADNDESYLEDSDIADNDESNLEEFDIADNDEQESREEEFYDDDDRWMMRGRHINYS